MGERVAIVIITRSNQYGQLPPGPLSKWMALTSDDLIILQAHESEPWYACHGLPSEAMEGKEVKARLYGVE